MASAKTYDFIVMASIMLLGVMPWIWKKLQSKKFFNNYPTANYYLHAALLYAAYEMLRRLLSIPWILSVHLLSCVRMYGDLFAWKMMSLEIVGLFIAMGVFSKTGKAFPFILAALIPIIHHLVIILVCYAVSTLTTPFDFSTPHGKIIQPLLEQQGFPLNHVFLEKTLPIPNAAHGGMWAFSRCIVVFKPMLDFATPEQLLGVIGHELGHGAHLHQLKKEIYLLVAGALTAVLCYYLLFRKSVYEAFGFTEAESESPSREIALEKEQNVAKPFVPKLILACIVLPWLFAPLLSVLPHTFTALKHFGEYQADRYAMNFGFAKYMSDLFLKFVKHGRQLVTHPVYDYVRNSHPTITRRINNLGVYELYE